MKTMAIELFCCAGGMAEGFRRAGIEFELAFDADPNACDSYAANLGHRPVRVDVHDLVRLARAGWRPDVWLLVADPPCTPWSSGGKRQGLDDPRDCMRPTIELIRLLRPLCYLIGNVPGLEHAPNAKALESTIGTLTRDGYCTADFVVLDAADFGVPQHRVRPFWFGHRRGTPCLTWPARTHGPPTTMGDLPGCELAPWVTAGAALADIPVEDLGRVCHVTEHGNAHPNDVKLDQPARTQNANPEGCSVLRFPLGGSGKSKTTDPRKPARAVTAKSTRAGNVLKRSKKHPPTDPENVARTVTSVQGGGCKGDVLLAPWLDERPSTTVTTDRNGRIGSPGTNVRKAGAEGKHYYDNAIVLSEVARARLQGFPDGWVFSGKTKKSRNAQIGMAMPPPLAHAVADAIARWRAALTLSSAEGQ